MNFSFLPGHENSYLYAQHFEEYPPFRKPQTCDFNDGLKSYHMLSMMHTFCQEIELVYFRDYTLRNPTVIFLH